MCGRVRNKLKSLKVAQSKDDYGGIGGGVVNACMNGCVIDCVCDDVHDGVCDIVLVLFGHQIR